MASDRVIVEERVGRAGSPKKRLPKHMWLGVWDAFDGFVTIDLLAQEATEIELWHRAR